MRDSSVPVTRGAEHDVVRIVRPAGRRRARRRPRRGGGSCSIVRAATWLHLTFGGSAQRRVSSDRRRCTPRARQVHRQRQADRPGADDRDVGIERARARLTALARVPSVELGARALDDVGPLHRLAGDEAAELGRGRRARLDAGGARAGDRPRGRRAPRAISALQPRDDRRRRRRPARRRRTSRSSRSPRGRPRRASARRAAAAAACGLVTASATQLAGLDVLQRRGQVDHRQRHLAAEDVERDRARALVRRSRSARRRAISLNSCTDRCIAVPLPPWPTASLPGSAFACAIRSATLLIGDVGGRR